MSRFSRLAIVLAVLFTSPLASAQGWVVAEGGGIGGSETYMADLFSFMVEKAKAAAPVTPVSPGQAAPGPRVAIIGAVPLEKDERVDAFKKAGASEVVCLIITEANADAQETFDALSRVDIIFIRGGDQGRYVNWWRGKKTEAAIKAVFARGGVVSGSSAGCAIMGEWTYDAVKDGLSPREALSDARHDNLSITHGFLGLVPNVLFDTHFTERGRLPRTIVMLARIAATRAHGWTDAESKGFTAIDVLRTSDRGAMGIDDKGVQTKGAKRPTPDQLSPLAIGVDPRTAVCVGPDHIAIVKGEGTATLLRLTKGTRVISLAGQPPCVTNVHYSQLLPGTTFNTQTGEVVERPAQAKYGISIETPTRQIIGPIAIDGGKPDDAKLGIQYVANAERREAEKKEDAGDKRPDASIENGSGKLPVIVTTAAWSKRHPQWAFAISEQALATRPGMMAFFLDEGCRLSFEDLGVVRVLAPEGAAGSSCVILDSRASRFVGSVEARPPRVHLEDAIVHVVAPGQTFDMVTGKIKD